MTDFQYDFSGIASKYNTRCNDGRVIVYGAFGDDNGKIVPLLWQHDHTSPKQVLGKALLQETPEGVKAYCSLNDTELGEHTKKCIKHGDLVALSIWADGLHETNKIVHYGEIKEVSVVLAGANPGAKIDNVMIHSDEDGYSAEIRFYDPSEISIFEDGGIMHSEDIYDDDDYDDDDYYDPDDEDYDDDDETDDDPDEDYDDDDDDEDDEDYGDDDDEDDEDDEFEHSDLSVAEILGNLNEEQQNAVSLALQLVAGMAADAATAQYKEDTEMRHSLYDSGAAYAGAVLTKDEQAAFLSHAEENGYSFRKVINDFIDQETEDFLAHDDLSTPTYGITDINLLFPDAKNYTDKPEFIKRRTEWVNAVMTGVHRTPFSRVKSLFADITKDDARAKGYTKGDLKEDEVFELLTRDTSPQTIYKRQRIDKDDRDDIVDFDIVMWIKGEMRLMWEEEVARAILIGDGRSNDNKFKIKEDKVRPIWTDASLYTVPVRAAVTTGATDDARTNAIIRKIIKDRKNYRGSGSPVLFTTEDFIADCLLLTDDIGREKYDSVEKLAVKLRVSRIIPVEVMEGKSRTVKLNPSDVETVTVYLDGILVNLNDYNVGADKGGRAEMFEDFDLDYNQYIFLYEGRMSGALVKPYSAMAIEHYFVAPQQAAG